MTNETVDIEHEDGRTIREIKAVPDELNRESVFVTFEEPDGSISTELMHPVDVTALLKQRETGYLSDAFEVMVNTPKT